MEFLTRRGLHTLFKFSILSFLRTSVLKFPVVAQRVLGIITIISALSLSLGHLHNPVPYSTDISSTENLSGDKFPLTINLSGKYLVYKTFSLLHIYKVCRQLFISIFFPLL
jgi:hypothetical protein